MPSDSSASREPRTPAVLTFKAAGFPARRHDAELGMFCRQEAMPGHRQESLEAAHFVVVGCGGLGSAIALGLARAGARQLTLIDPDAFERTNAPRQMMFAEDVGEPKAHALARNLLPHMTNPGVIHAIALPFVEALEVITAPVHAWAVGVDNNAARILASRYAVRARCHAVFAMLSADGRRAQCFWQTPGGRPCLRCVLPNIDPDVAAPCAAASIASCLLACAHAVAMLADAAMGAHNVPAWRETSLDGSTERSCEPVGRPDCVGCGTLTAS